MSAAARIRRARSDEAERLSRLAFRSKAHWGYSPEFMEACRRELTLSAPYLEEHDAFVLEAEDGVVGFYTLERISDRDVELGHLFVEPAAIGRGHGRALIEHAVEQARRLGFAVLVIQGDPNAEPFYLRAGARAVGRRQSASIAGRELPLFELSLDGRG
jgi:GNAT superfamily N-acetyltransferase